MTQLKIACALALALVACKKEPKTEAGKADPATTPPAAAKPAPAADPQAAPVAPPSAGGGAAADNSDPVKVVEQIFAAASSGNADALAGLCDPAGSGDGDVKSVCATKAGDPTWARFAKDFSTGKVEGPATIQGDTAEVTFLFGRDGTRKETMNLNKVGGKWYLGSF